MRRIFWILFVVGLVGCQPPEPVSFVKLDRVKVNEIVDGKAFVTGDAIFYNPNKKTALLKSADLDVDFKDEKLATVVYSEPMSIPAQSRFTIPIDIQIDMAVVQKNALATIIGAFLNQKVALRYHGKIKVKYRGIGYAIPVDFTEKMDLRKLSSF